MVLLSRKHLHAAEHEVSISVVVVPRETQGRCRGEFGADLCECLGLLGFGNSPRVLLVSAMDQEELDCLLTAVRALCQSFEHSRRDESGVADGGAGVHARRAIINAELAFSWFVDDMVDFSPVPLEDEVVVKILVTVSCSRT